ncbi:Disintegrin and metalloproteinase domain-containing protein 32, partial [Galemys pyrenaicus]
FQNSFLQIIFPEKIQANTSNNSKRENEQISYIIPIDEKPYIVHLKQRLFLAENFMVYLYNQGSLTSHHSDIQTHCHYQGYIEGYPNSVVTLNTCSGLRGLLQFENVSYVIEPLESEDEFQHLIYKLRNERNDSTILAVNNQGIEQTPMDYNIFISEESEPAVSDLIPLYLEMHIVVDKILYDYLGSDGMIVTSKVIEIIGLVNSMFAQFKVTIVLSSLELWSDKNKISTVGEADELLHAFLEWKKSYLTLRPHDIAYLFMDYSDYVGATFPGKMCTTQHSAGIVLFTKKITLEAFSVIVTQMLGLSLGISYDDPKKCQCPGVICIMNPEAMQFSGVKTFSSCSLSDFENFISNMGAKCLQNKPQMQSAQRQTCGNGIVEGKETCDCGTIRQCTGNVCCDPRTCKLKPGAECDKGMCCKKDCKFQSAGYECRRKVHPECDISEYCNGSSANCQPDVTIHNGHLCKDGKLMCYDGECHDLDARCEAIFGKGSRNAPFFCYEEVHSQSDRFGNCGFQKGKYVMCYWRSLMCGRLVCTYPTRIPFREENISVIYAYLRDIVCVTVDYRVSDPLKDPLMIRSGSACDTGRVCMSSNCVESRWIEYQERDCTKKCNGNGVKNILKMIVYIFINNPRCAIPERNVIVLVASNLPIVQRVPEHLLNCLKNMASLITERTLGHNPWFLIVYTVLPVLIIALIMVVSWYTLKKRFTKEEETISSE